MSTKTDYTYSRRYVIFFYNKYNEVHVLIKRAPYPIKKYMYPLSIYNYLVFRCKNLDINLCSYQCVHQHKHFLSFLCSMLIILITTSTQHALSRNKQCQHLILRCRGDLGVVQETNWAFMSGSGFKLFKEFIFKKNCVTECEAQGKGLF